MQIEIFDYLYNSNDEAVVIRRDGFGWVLEYEDGLIMRYRTREEAIEQAAFHGYIF